MKRIGGFFPAQDDVRRPSDVAVVMPTILRPCIERAIRSVYAQTLQGTIQLVIGVDVATQSTDLLIRVLEQRPAHVSALVLGLPFSTSRRHGGVHTPIEGGAVRAILSLAANSRRAAYLDDDNAWEPEHLELLCAALGEDADYAFSRRRLVDGETGEDFGLDEVHSLGPNAGAFARHGGFVDPNCLMIRKDRLARHLGAWADTVDGKMGASADKNFFLSIAQRPHARVEQATVRYSVRPDNPLIGRRAP